MKIEPFIEKFLNYISIERNLSRNTAVSYRNDLKRYVEYLKEQNIESFDDAKPGIITSLFDMLQPARILVHYLSQQFQISVLCVCTLCQMVRSFQVVT